MGEDAKAHAAFASVLLALGRHRQAADEYVRAAALGCNEVALWTNLAEARLGGLDHAGALDALDRALRLDPRAQHPAGRRAIALALKIHEVCYTGR